MPFGIRRLANSRSLPVLASPATKLTGGRTRRFPAVSGCVPGSAPSTTRPRGPGRRGRPPDGAEQDARPPVLPGRLGAELNALGGLATAARPARPAGRGGDRAPTGSGRPGPSRGTEDEGLGSLPGSSSASACFLRVVAEDGAERLDGPVAGEGPPAGQHLEEGRAEREDVRAPVDRTCRGPARATCSPPCRRETGSSIRAPRDGLGDARACARAARCGRCRSRGSWRGLRSSGRCCRA